MSRRTDPSNPSSDPSPAPEDLDFLREISAGPGSTPPIKRAPTKAGSIGLYLFATAVVLAALSLAAWRLGQRDDRASIPAEGDVYSNPERGYAVQAPSSTWRSDPQRARREKADIALVDDAHQAWLIICATDTTGGPRSASPTLADSRSRFQLEWKDVRERELPATTLAQIPADLWEVSGFDDQTAMKARVLGARRDHLVYQFLLIAPQASFAGVERDWARTIASVRWTPMTAPALAKPSVAMEAFSSERYPYRLNVPVGAWRRQPTESADRFADLRLTDRTKSATVTISPRGSLDVTTAVDAYLERQRRLFPSSLHRPKRHNVTIAGRAGQRVELSIVDPEIGDFFLSTAFVSAPPLVYQIELRGSATDADRLKPQWSDIEAGFEITGEHALAAPTRSMPARKIDDDVGQAAPPTPTLGPLPARSARPEKKPSANPVTNKDIAKKDGSTRAGSAPPAKNSKSAKRTLDDLD